MFDRTEMRRMMERACGVEYLEGWVDQGPGAFPGLTARPRAFGARCVHVIAGNAPIVCILTVIRNEIGRASCREGGCQYVEIRVVAVQVTQKHKCIEMELRMDL